MPLINNAVISTYAGGVAKLVGVDAMIGIPTALDMAQFGGSIRHLVLLDPRYNGVPTDVQRSDLLQINSWGLFTVDTTKRYFIVQCQLSGGLGIEQYRLIVGDKPQG